MALERKLLETEGRCFRFKASFSPCLVIEILRYDLEAIQAELAEMVVRTPKFFTGSAVVIDLVKAMVLKKQDFDDLKLLLQSQGLIPVGIRSTHQIEQDSVALSGLPLMNPASTAKLSSIEVNSQPTTIAPKDTTKCVTTPIRSGMQLYAREGDLIVTTKVSPGAELVAAGHIHVYGALQGRALAGAYGNKAARIFCKTLEAELVSIAGYYLTKEEMSLIPASANMIQIYLENDTLQIKAL